MSLQEFFSDESYGGSWADEDFDMASISVPIEKNRGYNEGSYYSNNNSYGGGFGRGGSSFIDNGPPYIVKLSNIPVTSNNGFIEDLFHSRFAPFVKFKIIFDPSSHPLESGIVKKIAFVELPSFEIQSKVCKWQDVVYNGSRRVNIDVGAFEDFQYCMSFNQEHQSELLEVERQFLSSRPRHGFGEDPSSRNRHGGRAPGGMPLDDIPLPSSHASRFRERRPSTSGPGFPSFHDRAPPSAATPALAAPPKPKSNPFGNAKPVDVLAKEQEIGKKVVAINSTTFKTIGHEDEPATTRRGSSGEAKAAKPGPVPAPIPAPIYGQSQSLADILSNRKSDVSLSQPSKPSTPKVSAKPIILKKKPATATPEPEAEPQAETDDLPAKLENVALKDTESSAVQTAPKSKKEPRESRRRSSTKKNESSRPVTNITEPNSAVHSSGRPDFKKHFGEMISSAEAKEHKKHRNGDHRHEHNGEHKHRSEKDRSEKRERGERKDRVENRDDHNGEVKSRRSKSASDGDASEGPRRQRRPSSKGSERPRRNSNAVERKEKHDEQAEGGAANEPKLPKPRSERRERRKSESSPKSEGTISGARKEPKDSQEVPKEGRRGSADGAEVPRNGGRGRGGRGRGRGGRGRGRGRGDGESREGPKAKSGPSSISAPPVNVEG